MPIVYGYPTSETIAASQRGEVLLGGCTEDEVHFGCRECAQPPF